MFTRQCSNFRNLFHIWVADRCGVNSCGASTLDPVFEFDQSGKVVKNFSVLKAVSGTPGVTRAFNSHRQVVWRTAFTDGTTAIILTQAP